MSKLDRAEFGPNAWLLDEMYRRYREDPSSVGERWREFFEDYRPQGDDGQPAPAPARPAGRAAPAAGKETEAEPAPSRPDEEAEPLRGAAAVIAQRMQESLTVPTATSVRTVPAKLLEVNRNILNRHLARGGGGKVSFTHLIGFAIARAMAAMPGMNVSFGEAEDGSPQVVRHPHVNLGLAVDVKRKDGSRTLLVPNIKEAETLDFRAFLEAYEALIRKVDAGKLSPDDFAGTTVTITNPGTIGTVQSVPRLMAGQAAIFGVGAIAYPAEYQGADPESLAEVGVGKVLTLTSTYDHRVIQGAESGEFLGRVHRLLLGEEGFYDDVFASIGVPYVPVQWHLDENPRPGSLEAVEKQAAVLRLIRQYRVRGHLIADLDPLDMKPIEMHPELDPATYGLTIWDLDRRFATDGLAGERELTLGQILAVLRDAYCRTATVEYMHIQEPDQKLWIQERVEGATASLPPEDQRHILSRLNEAEALETFLHRRYIGHKRFSLEGSESLIPMLDAMLSDAAEGGVEEAVIGMSHRGRLDVLTSIVGKSFGQVFQHFEGEIDPDAAQGSGDVKYHIGAGGKFAARSGSQLVVTVASNPSHLESVDPVVEGIVRAKQDLLDRREEAPVLPLLLHGDAAFAGQGVVAETLAMSALRGYGTGGTVHVVVNNQLGFTTGSDYGRSSTYASDVARMVQAPIFHVNGDDPEACVRVARLAFAFRQRFKKDVVIDMWCYRRWGHNEADEPAFTQPVMYRRIRERRSVRKLYTEVLIKRGDLSLEEAEGALDEYRKRLQEALDQTKAGGGPARIEWTAPRSLEKVGPIETGVEHEVLDRVVQALTTVPEGFHLHPKLAKWFEERRLALGEDAVDWSLAEGLAIGSLLLEGVWVRLTGQDTRRGTFSQRHAALVDQETGREHLPMLALGDGADGRGRFFVYDSLLSEFAALGFEYGYSVANKDALVLWEAQFGDFVNGAQVVVDQFVSAAEDKWGQTSGLVVLLPHGFEGQGPEHSSARLERFLQLAAQDNMVVAVPSTPAQYFHLLRRQALREIRKPLVVMTPKSLLRLPAARSSAAELTGGSFLPVLPDPAGPDPGSVRRVILCQGKVFHDLAARREEAGVKGVALVRVEEPYPFPVRALREQLDRYPKDAETWWVQEEPENMGAWRYMGFEAWRQMKLALVAVSRPESASPATGSLTVHRQEQDKLLDRAFAG
ncbi:MAG: multifunctional oxoglutarate decarboxylase/oxoglutarate dehydrogenase thiamine pyrophosphate-binding subunit/dihydrolipoyllysine-residue succinyltransferase subunit [Actinobacteria bacterium]|nr:multifunctional oxoglutarate decarboxylase/oxoglutarate dehydrogenase thiamine pyrophosphate-binding subunit/dihydrolipoyllysine-residue succinyltransferase subunit [Actinomycetota bacterium]